MDFFLEDDSARVELQFPTQTLPSLNFVTGVSVALLGTETESGTFMVEDWCFAGLDEASKPTDDNVKDGTIALVSGANFSPKQALRFDLLHDLLTGSIPDPVLYTYPIMAHTSLKNFADVQRVVFVGNLAERPSRTDETTKKKYGVEQAKYDFSSMNLLDPLLNSLVQSIPVDVMPGAGDPTNLALPQSPIQPGLFPLTHHNSSFTSVMNPHSFHLNGRRFLGTSGQNIDDIARYSDIPDRLRIAEATLQWRNIAPTAPDTLCTYLA